MVTYLLEHNVMYGAGTKKLAQTLGKPEKEGARLKKSFYLAHPGIEELIDDLEKSFQPKEVH